MQFGGANVTITSAPGAVIDGNGQAYWDGQGSNGGIPKYVATPCSMFCLLTLHTQTRPLHRSQ